MATGPFDLDQSPRLLLAAYCHRTDHPRRPLSVAVLGVDHDNRAFSPLVLDLFLVVLGITSLSDFQRQCQIY